MPNRILKESICTSEEIDTLSFFQETFFYRLIVNCDDYGRMDARPKILAARLFPLKTVRTDTIEDALRALTSAELVTLYEIDGKPLLQMNTWARHQTVRATKSKYPAPPESNCMQLQADESKCSRNRIRIRESNSIIENEDEFYGHTFSSDLQSAVKEWLAYKKEKRESYKPTGQRSLMTQIEKKAEEFGEKAVIDLINECMANGWKGIIWDRIKANEKKSPYIERNDAAENIQVHKL